MQGWGSPRSRCPGRPAGLSSRAHSPAPPLPPARQLQRRGGLHLPAGLGPRAVRRGALERPQPGRAQGPVRLRPHLCALQQVLRRPLRGAPPGRAQGAPAGPPAAGGQSCGRLALCVHAGPRPQTTPVRGDRAPLPGAGKERSRKAGRETGGVEPGPDRQTDSPAEGLVAPTRAGRLPSPATPRHGPHRALGAGCRHPPPEPKNKAGGRAGPVRHRSV